MNEDFDFGIDRTSTGIKVVAVILSVLVYVSFVIYSEYHFYNLISHFVPSDFQAIGLVAVAASALTAIGLPVALHYWFREGKQQIVGFIFYGVHFLIVMLNLVLDGTLISEAAAAKAAVEAAAAQGLTAPAVVAGVSTFSHSIYATWILPAYIAFYGLFWSVLWYLDDGSARLDKKRELANSLEDDRMNRHLTVTKFRNGALAAAFKSQGAQAAINLWAAKNAPQLLARELGLSVDELGTDQDYRFWLPKENGQSQPESDAAPAVSPDQLLEILAGLSARLERVELMGDGAVPAGSNGRPK